MAPFEQTDEAREKRYREHMEAFPEDAEQDLLTTEGILRDEILPVLLEIRDLLRDRT